jgi:hypothetical protein
MLCDQQNPIHGQRARSQGQGIGDVGSDTESMRGGQEATDVIGRPLLDIEGGQLQRRVLSRAVEHVRQDQPAGDDIRMGIMTVHRGQNRDPFLRLRHLHRHIGTQAANCECSEKTDPTTPRGRPMHRTTKTGKREGLQAPRG